MRTGDIMRTDVSFVETDASVREAAAVMGDRNIRALPVGGLDALQGIITSRDILMRVVAQGRDNTATRVGEVMSSWVFVCGVDDQHTDVAQEMLRRDIRRMPVIDADRRVVGMVELGDLYAPGRADARRPCGPEMRPAEETPERAIVL